MTSTDTTATDRLGSLSAQGVSVWLDDLSRQRMDSGSLQSLIADHHVVGVTTNPSIFQKALSEGDAYDEQVKSLALQGADVETTIRTVTGDDVRRACDLLAPVWESSDHLDGAVSYEVDPRKAHDTDGTAAEAKELWELVDRPNLFVKIPATDEGLAAITSTLAAGISVNVTLIFSIGRYRDVMEAWLTGLEQAQAAGLPLRDIGSVASFFVSRVDSEVDKRIDALTGDQVDKAKQLRGKAAVANAALAYQAFEQTIASDRWKALASDGARVQRPLWASTGVKDKAYEDTRYVIELVAPNTVNTMPEDTLLAVGDHGEVRGDTISGTYAQAKAVLDGLNEVGVDWDDVVVTIEREGVEKFEEAWDKLLGTTKAELERLVAEAGK